MKIAFYAPLKSPEHPVPSGDRLMARQLRQALEMAGHGVELVSSFRAYCGTSDVPQERSDEAHREEVRIIRQWQSEGAPDLWFCYHPYYKAPDLLGPALCRSFGLPYVTVETSYSERRNIGGWQKAQDLVLEGIRQAAANICLTVRDRRGILSVAPEASVDWLPPFIDSEAFLLQAPQPVPGRLVTVAMMRPGDKLDSYRTLANALAELGDRPWQLDLVGDGPARGEVEVLFSSLPASRIRWHGQKSKDEIAAILASSSLYLWPGHGEAYGLAYLEAQASGLPVIALDVAGVPEVVQRDRTGLLVAPGDDSAYAAAIAALLDDAPRREALAGNARAFVRDERSLPYAAGRLNEILSSVWEAKHEP